MQKNEIKIISLNNQNIYNEHICCAIGNDKKNCERANIKKTWLKERFKDGHTFKKVDVRGKVFIEYVPIENAWFPIIAKDYTFIQCFWISGQYKGQGLSKILLEECEKDSIGKKGLIAISSPKKLPFMTDKSFYLKQGFEVCDTSYPYFELLVKKFDKKAENPCFTEKVKSRISDKKNGLVFYYSDACPFTNHHEIMVEVAKQRSIPYEVIKIETLQQAKDLPVAFSIFSVFLNGIFITHELMVEKKFNALLDKNLK